MDVLGQSLAFHYTFNMQPPKKIGGHMQLNRGKAGESIPLDCS